MRTGAKKGALGRSALVVGAGMLAAWSGQLPGATEPAAAEGLDEFIVVQSGTPSWARTDALTVPGHLVNVLMGYQDSPSDSDRRTWATIWIAQRWTFDPLLLPADTAKPSCTYCAGTIVEVIPLAFPYQPTRVFAESGFTSRGAGYPGIDAGSGSIAGPAVSFKPLDHAATGSPRQRTSSTPPLPFYAAASGNAVGFYPDSAAYSDAPGTTTVPYIVEPGTDTDAVTPPLPFPGSSAVDPAPYTNCAGIAWAGFGCEPAISDAYPDRLEEVPALLETGSIEELTSPVPEPGTLPLLGLGLLALGFSSLHATRRRRVRAS